MSARPECGWCSAPSCPGLVDETGDPVCLNCARVADRAAGREPLVEVTLYAVPDTTRRKPPSAWVAQIAEVIGLSREAHEIGGAGAESLVCDAARAWLAARGWCQLRAMRGAPPPRWRSRDRRQPVTMLRAVMIEATRVHGTEALACSA